MKIIKIIDYQFNNRTLLEQALTHRSIGNKNNERLEYLGDAILGFVIADEIYRKFPNASEGELTRLRASLVKGEKLAEISRELQLANEIKLGSGELKSGGWRRDSILANTLEALIGAVYLDSDIESCRYFILTLYQSYLENIDPTDIKKDAKTQLQEYLQSRKHNIPVYEIIDERGSAHQPEFTVSCKIDLLDEVVVAEGSSKRKAEQAAAEKTMVILESTS
ncbi:MAG: ribonuclease III [Proteobacteria bacterium]|nr:ribonuclease III [Pseudomonadota bacterium]